MGASFWLTSASQGPSLSIARRAMSTAGRGAPEQQPDAEPSTYLLDLLKADDADAPWHQAPVEMVSREVQSLSSAHKSWD
ncbi:hypothetical protein GGI25_004442 [Coemansia spiralis]|uniref:Uncharacterized protein n=2 Tax=Coemansia TaxID=4863 RepID=A0A9W8G4G5_9FUNG|nr:hypothetical protein GGI25_004442 [Coemansia spiralis]